MTQDSLKRYSGIAKSWNQFMSSGYIEIADAQLCAEIGPKGCASIEVFTPASSITARHGARRLTAGEPLECSIILRGLTYIAINVEFPKTVIS